MIEKVLVKSKEKTLHQLSTVRDRRNDMLNCVNSAGVAESANHGGTRTHSSNQFWECL